MKGKVVIRLMNITELQSLLESCMAVTPGFWPPCVNPEEVVLHPKVKKGKRYRKCAGIGPYAGVSGWSLVQWKE